MTPYQRIMRAAARGTGVRLSADEVAILAVDDAIFIRAELDDDQHPLPRDVTSIVKEHFDYTSKTKG